MVPTLLVILTANHALKRAAALPRELIGGLDRAGYPPGQLGLGEVMRHVSVDRHIGHRYAPFWLAAHSGNPAVDPS